jgi:DNA-binding response OmpR family regulator
MDEQKIIPSPATIYAVEDEPDILELILINLRKSGYKAKGFQNGTQLISQIKTSEPDLIILDIMLPDMDGIEICKYIKNDKSTSHIPIIFLTAKTDLTDKVLGLELGADDYITKPFSISELLARVKVILRRADNSVKSKQISFADILVIDFEKYEVFVKGNSIKLTATEFKILQQLASRRGWVFTREQILDNLGYGSQGVIDRTIDVHIKNLRDKLADAASLIKNVRGIGYKIDEVIK